LWDGTLGRRPFCPEGVVRGAVFDIYHVWNSSHVTKKKEIILVLIAILISDRVTCKMEQLISSIYLDVLTIGVMLSIGLVIKNNLLFFNF